MAEQERKLVPHLGPAGAWAMALGTSIGWGSLVITSNTYLAEAGPLGSTLGLAAGAVIMLIISRNYQYLMNCFPDAGGSYAYVRETLGHDHGFLVSWFLSITYLAMLWANATALPLFVRYFFGNIFEFGRLYSLFGYEVYLGEAILTLGAIGLTALLCANSRKITAGLMIGMVACFAAGITVCFAAAMLGRDRPMSPGFVPDAKAITQVLGIAAISPWAFIGFENISHAAEEITFRPSGFRRVLRISVITTALLYIFVVLLSTTAYPERYGSWLAYVRDLGSLEGIEALPAFYAARHYLGGAGVGILMAALLSLVLTSLIGNTLALSRLFYALGKDRILPKSMGKLNRKSIPGRAVLMIAGVSLLIPFAGRTAIGWIVDVTTIGATLVYGYVSACAMKKARLQGDRAERRTGIAGLLLMIGISLYMTAPSLFSAGKVETESYFLFVVWSVLGFVYFRMILKKDRENRFGRSIVVWIALLSLILFVSLVWMSQSVMKAASDGMNSVAATCGGGVAAESAAVSEAQMTMVRSVNARSLAVVVGLFALSLGVLLNNYSLMSRKARESETQLGIARDLANKDPLTGVKSKHAYVTKEKETDEAIAAGTVPDFALAVCDVNGLKQINDTLGHKAGDEHIRKACRMICWIFEHSPVYRTGGDEFVVYLQGPDFECRRELMEMLHNRSAEHIPIGEAVVSGGLAEYRRGEDGNIHSVFERADARMYEEKQLLKSMGAVSR